MIIFSKYDQMGEYNSNIPLKLRLFLPIAFIIIVIITIASFLIIRNSLEVFDLQAEKNLELEVKTIDKMFERERQLKMEKVEVNLRVTHNLFYGQAFNISNQKRTVKAINQLTNEIHEVAINEWLLNGRYINDDFSFVDSVRHLLGCTATIFQKIDEGYIRMSTNVENKDGSRALNTFIPNSSPVIQAIEQKQIYYGRAYVVNDWYITAYEPIIKNDEVLGMLYVGEKEKDLPKLREILYGLKIGKTGYPFVFDKNGIIVIHPSIEGQNWKDSTLFKNVERKNGGIIKYNYLGNEKLAAFTFNKDFEFYIFSSIETKAENRQFIRNTILTSVLIAIISVVLLLVVLYFLTAERIYHYLKQLNISKEKLNSATEALKQSELNFQTLFNSTGDDIYVTDDNGKIIEVNQSSCNSLGYTREEFLQMKMIDLKTSRYSQHLSENREKIYTYGQYTFESEHVTKDGRVIQVEITSRIVDFDTNKYILSVARNIGLRKETEREVLSAVIRTEERERERFAKDMHDSIGPLMSTVKLYVNELKSPNLELEERTDFVNQTNNIIDEAVNSIRTISNNLMPRVIHNYGLVTAIESFCEKVNKTNTININFVKKNIKERFDQNLELILFRVTTELINNTIKHAKAKHILIELKKSTNQMKLYFVDDGIGFNKDEIMTSEQKGMGLKNIISRIKSINGAYKIESSPNRGFKIKVNIDL